MFVLETASNSEIRAEVKPVREADLKKLNRWRYFFDWKQLYGSTELYKLCLEGDEDIKGLMAIVDYPEEYRIEVRLIAASKENVSLKLANRKTTKEYDQVALCLMEFAARTALVKYGFMACLSLVPKTSLRNHYIKKYGMKGAGLSLYLDSIGMQKLIQNT